MALQFDPTLLFGTSGNALAYTTLNNYATSPSSTSFIVDFSTVLGGYVQIWNVGGGTVNATNGTLVQVFSTPDNVWYDTVQYPLSFLFTTVVSTTQRQSFFLDNGKYTIALTNQDPSNAIHVMASTGLIV